MESKSLVVLGAGIQGTCLALALASRGRRVTLLEANPTPLSATSIRNEGKIHLGFVYALDQTGSTQRKMLESALCFSRLLDEWCGPLPWKDWSSNGFVYAMMPDSLVDREYLYHSYELLKKLLVELNEDAGSAPSYLDRELSWLWKPSEPHRQNAFRHPSQLLGLVDTQEVALDTKLMGKTLSKILQEHPLIDLRCGVRVEKAERDKGGFRLQLQTSEGNEFLDTEVVANCAWVDRLRLDETIGLVSQRAPICYRIKHSIEVRVMNSAHGLCPLTMVQGPYGDIVPRNNGLVYLSWYPECRTWIGDQLPQEMLGDEIQALEVSRRSLAAFQERLPGLEGVEIVSSLPGVIIAPGQTDIEDPKSQLHARDQFGVQSHDGWWTIDTGKFTSAPLNADIAARQIAEVCV